MIIFAKYKKRTFSNVQTYMKKLIFPNAQNKKLVANFRDEPVFYPVEDLSLLPKKIFVKNQRVTTAP